jgi:hypothetical protein
MKYIYLLFLIFFINLESFCLEGPKIVPDFEQNPTGIKWKYLLTENFEIIFPEEVSFEAQRVGHLLEKIYPYVCRSLEVTPPRIPLVLQNQSINSNGFVTLAPRRSEWFLSPTIDPELSNTEWLRTLAIHEFRHVVQFYKTRQGFNDVYRVFFGQIGEAIGISLTLPPWFLEGDAVGIETALTQGGRGRLPLFERDLRTVLLSEKKWNYDKSHLGSYEDYVPNHYVYGYFFTSWLRNNFGDLFLSELVNHSAAKSWNPLTFYNASKELSGKSFETLYKKMISEFSKDWKNKIDLLSPTPFQVISPVKKNGWANYSYPQLTKSGIVISLKNGLSFIPEFVMIEDKQEKHLFFPGILQNEYPFKVRDGKLVYFELQIDPRWGYRDFSTLKVYDIEKKEFVLEKKDLKGRVAIPNHTGDKIIYVEWDEFQNQYLVVLNLKGKELLRFPYSKDKVITSLDWLNNDEIILVTKNQSDLKSIIKLNLINKWEEALVDKRLLNIGSVSVENNHVFFEAPDSGIDNIWVLTKSGPRQITSSLFGAYYPTLFLDKLIYGDYSVDGMRIVQKNLNWSEEQSSSDSFVPVYEKFSQSENYSGLKDESDSKKEYPLGDYSQFKNSINLHSWVILAPPLSNTITFMGISRDVLNKFSLSFGAEYNLNERALQGFTGATWSHYVPVFDLRAAYGGRRQNILLSGEEIENKWEEGTFESGLSLPWRSIRGRFTNTFRTRLFAKIIKVTNKLSTTLNEINDGAMFSPGFEASYGTLQRLSKRDMNPNLGFSLDTKFEEGRDFTGDQQRGRLFSSVSRVYLPGLRLHHSFNHQFTYERQNAQNYEYASQVFYPRGTNSFFLSEFTKYSGNYLFPISYPDWNLSRYLYLKRMSLNLFYDELSGVYSNFSYKAASTGLETILEMNFLRLTTPISVGFRGNYVLNGYANKKVSYEIFLTSILGSF